jgi:hypothetical protein
MFREDEHREKCIGVEIRHWQTTHTSEEKRMKSRLGTLILEGSLSMNFARCILVSTLLAVVVTPAAMAQSAPAVSSAEARKAI